VIESKVCDSCETAKPLTEFVGTSDRCQECFDKMRDIGRSIIERTDSDG
jgi:bacterioferritin-associated ferredoxin